MGCITSCASRSSATATARASPWADLPPDLLLEISGRLQHTADVVRFYAVCRSWRHAAPASSRSKCLPWVLTSWDGEIVHSVVDFRCSVETPTYRPIHGDDTPTCHHGVIIAKPRGTPRIHTRNWVASTDGMTAWIFVALPEPRLINILTGAVTRLPSLPDEARMSMEDFCGIVDVDGTLFLYNFETRFRLLWHEAAFTAAILCPGDAAWKLMKKTLDLSAQPYATFHDRNVIVWADDSVLCFLMTQDVEANGADISDSLEAGWNLEEEDINYSHQCSYILESHGEMLWASVLLKWTWKRHGYGDPARALRVTVRVMQKDLGSGKMKWARKEGWSLGDRVLFLGSPASFAMKLDEGNGCAYFVYGGGVFRYNFVLGEAKLMKWLRSGCYAGQNCAWLRPSLSFTPIQEIKKRLEARSKMRNS